MKAKELMIGDWVLYNGQPKVVQMIDGYGDTELENEILCDGMYHKPIEVSPIPLSAEILEKNGFEELMSEGEEVAAMFGRKPELTGVWQYGFGRFDSVAYVPERSFLHIKFMEGCQADIANIKYVHELQHALRLCGVEKEVEL